MDKDYFINDDDGYNWVSLSKPLSNYTQEELALHLISNKKEYGTTQKIRLDGKIGTILTTDGCDTPEEFIEKYKNILDRAGFKKGNNMNKEEIKEAQSTLIIKPKALSKVSFMDYTQEELAHLVMDDKIKNNDGTEYGIYEHRNTIFDSTGCNTIEDFINKYQDEFKKRLIKSENPKNNEKVPTEKNAMKIIEVPFGMFKYTQEDLAHLVMDNKKEDEVVGIRVKDVIYDSIGCKTVEDFINKNEKVATMNHIEHDYQEKILKAGNIEDLLYENKTDEIEIQKNNDLARIKKLELELADAPRGLSLISLAIADVNNKARIERKRLQLQLDLIDKVLVEKGNDEFEDKAITEDEKKANDAYKIASITYGTFDIEKALSLINLLPDESTIKQSLNDATMQLFKQYSKADYERYPELVDRDKYLNMLEKCDEKEENDIARLNAKSKTLMDLIKAKTIELSELKYKNQEANIETDKNVDKESIEKNEISEDINPNDVEEYNLDLDKKEGLIDKLKNKKVKEKEVNHIDQEYMKKLDSIGKIFTDEERIDPNHNYLTADNAKNLGYIDVITEGPKEEVISKIEMEEDNEKVKKFTAPIDEDNKVEAFELEKEEHEPIKFEFNDESLYEFSLDDDEYDLSLGEEKDSLKDFVAINSFKQISKDLYDKINNFKVKPVIKKAVEKLSEKKKAVCKYLGFAAVLAGIAVAGHNSQIKVTGEELETKVNFEPIMEQNTENETKEEFESLDEVRTSDNVNATFSEEPEYTVSLADASNATIADVMEGKTDVYRSFADAYTETHAVEANNVFMPSWQNAKGGEYFVEQDGVMKRLSKDEAEDYYKNGENIVESVKNENEVIGYVNIENNNSVMSK